MRELMERFKDKRFRDNLKELFGRFNKTFGEEGSDRGTLNEKGEVEFSGSFLGLEKRERWKAAKEMYERMVKEFLELDKEIYNYEEFKHNPKGGALSDEVVKYSKFKDAVLGSIIEAGPLSNPDLMEIMGSMGEKQT